MTTVTAMNESNPFSFDIDENGVATFVVNRPAKLNALTRPVLDGLASALDQLEKRNEEQPCVLIVSGTGDRAFCAGTDLAEIQGMDRDQRMEKNKFARDLFFRLSESPVISIAAINGLAYGGGLELAMACTFRLAPAHVKLALPEIKLGLLPAYAGTQFLPALIGADRALDMMITGEPVDAEAACQMGLITRLADPSQELMDQARAWACGIAAMSRPAVNAIRQCVAVAGSVVTPEGLAVEDEQVRAVFGTEDAREGVAAFLEKRAAVFRHR